MPGRPRPPFRQAIAPVATLIVLALAGVVAVLVPLRLAGRLPLHRGLPPPLAPRSAAISSAGGSSPLPADAADSPVHLAYPTYTPGAMPISDGAVSSWADVTSSIASPAGDLALTATLRATTPSPSQPAVSTTDSGSVPSSSDSSSSTSSASSPPSSTLGSQYPTSTVRIGILAGHWQYDTGTVCADGRREVDVTLDVAKRTKSLLEARGFIVDLLPELDPDTAGPPLQGYQANAFVSIHADTCQLPGYSGFKISRWRYSTMPTVDDRLVSCLYSTYAAATNLPRHDTTVSINMWNYYAFRELAVETPAAIIELGFMLDDEPVLDGKRYEMAEGVAKGVACFLGR